MLGGLAYVHSDDVAWSRKFIKGLQKKKVIRDKAVLDIGAGIGRVSSYCLKDCFVNVDMLEQNKVFIEASETNFAKGRIRNRFNIPVQQIGSLVEKGMKYDLVWIQWVVGHLSDEQFVDLLKSAKQLANTVIIKDNYVHQGEDFWFDETDGNILRSMALFDDVFRAAGLKVIEAEDQPTWPKNLMPIKIWVL